MQPLTEAVKLRSLDIERVPKPNGKCPECGEAFEYERDPKFSEYQVVSLPDYLVSRSVWRELPHPACEAKHQERERAAIEEQKRTELSGILRGSGFPGDVMNKTLETFRVDAENQGAIELIRRWAPSDRFGFWFQGPAGSGKSHLMASFVHRYVAASTGKLPSMAWWSLPFLFDQMGKDFAREDGAEPAFNRVLRAEVLFLDDLGAQQGKPWETERLFQIFDYRTNWQLPTFVTTNLSADEIKATMHERVSSRLIGLCVPVTLFGRDKRHNILADRRRSLMRRPASGAVK